MHKQQITHTQANEQSNTKRAPKVKPAADWPLILLLLLFSRLLLLLSRLHTSSRLLCLHAKNMSIVAHWEQQLAAHRTTTTITTHNLLALFAARTNFYWRRTLFARAHLHRCANYKQTTNWSESETNTRSLCVFVSIMPINLHTHTC